MRVPPVSPHHALGARAAEAEIVVVAEWFQPIELPAKRLSIVRAGLGAGAAAGGGWALQAPGRPAGARRPACGSGATGCHGSDRGRRGHRGDRGRRGRRVRVDGLTGGARRPAGLRAALRSPTGRGVTGAPGAGAAGGALGTVVAVGAGATGGPGDPGVGAGAGCACAAVTAATPAAVSGQS